MAANNYPPLTREDLRQELQNELRHYATKEDVAQMETRLVKWMIGLVVAAAGVGSTVTLVIQRFLA